MWRKFILWAEKHWKKPDVGNLAPTLDDDLITVSAKYILYSININWWNHIQLMSYILTCVMQKQFLRGPPISATPVIRNRREDLLFGIWSPLPPVPPAFTDTWSKDLFLHDTAHLKVVRCSCYIRFAIYVDIKFDEFGNLCSFLDAVEKLWLCWKKIRDHFSQTPVPSKKELDWLFVENLT